MKIHFIFIISLLFFGHLNSKSINGAELEQKVSDWLINKNQKPHIKILSELKYPFCNDDNLLFSDISGTFKLIKVTCTGENKWSFITRNKKNFKKELSANNNESKVLVLKSSKKSGSIIREDDIIIIKKKIGNKSDLIVEKKDIIGKKLKNSMSSNRPLHYSNIQKDWLIEKNSNIIIENVIGNIVIKEEGIALENADFREKIQVKNLKSGKIIQGFAKNEKKVVLKTKQFWFMDVIYIK